MEWAFISPVRTEFRMFVICCMPFVMSVNSVVLICCPEERCVCLRL